MEDLSLHILDIVENSINAGAKNIEINIFIERNNDTLRLIIKDDGKGMTEEEKNKVFDPFYTGNKHKKTGLGLSLLRDSALKAEGDVAIISEKEKGTEIHANFKISHPDMIPLGNLYDTMLVLVMANKDTRFKLRHLIDNAEFKFDTAELDHSKNDTISYLKEVKAKLENYQKFLGTIKGDFYGI